MSDYDVYSQPSKSSAGGSAIYVRSNISHRLRADPSALEEEFETVLVEIENIKSKNILCCCAYRHPNTDRNKFVKYFENTYAKLDENKDIYLYIYIKIYIYIYLYIYIFI